MRPTVTPFRSAGQQHWFARQARRTVWEVPHPAAGAPGGHVAQILWFENYQPADAPVLGGKNASLGALLAAGLPVPPGFAVSADCYRKALADGGLTGQLDALIAAVDPHDPASVAAAGARARALIGSLVMPGDLADAIRAAYTQLCSRCGDSDVPVAVRSSATCEDQPDASFAGEHDTYLWVRGGDSVVTHVLRCWASLFTDRGIAYRIERGYGRANAAMSVGVQQMVRPRAAGVAFTLNPLNGDRSQVAIDASWGFGEAVVSGEVTPDNFLVDKVMGTVNRRTISAKTLEYRLVDGDAVTAVPVDADRQSVPCLSDEEILAVARLARRAEKHYRCPQDVEWALEASGDVLLLQSRPETVWSRRARPAASCTADPAAASTTATRCGWRTWASRSASCAPTSPSPARRDAQAADGGRRRRTRPDRGRVHRPDRQRRGPGHVRRQAGAGPHGVPVRGEPQLLRQALGPLGGLAQDARPGPSFCRGGVLPDPGLRRTRQAPGGLRRGTGHDGLGDPGADHRPDRGAPGTFGRRGDDAAADVQGEHGFGGPGGRPARGVPGLPRPDRPTVREEQVRRRRLVRHRLHRPGLVPVQPAGRCAEEVAHQGERKPEGRGRVSVVAAGAGVS